jgi:hypothetical protein
MKHCTKCHRQYDDPSLKFCTEDGTPLTHFDSEAETVKIPDLSTADIEMEIADYLRRNVKTVETTLIKFEDLIGVGLTTQRISECFETAADKAGYDVIEKTATRATIERRRPLPPRLVRA